VLELWGQARSAAAITADEPAALEPLVADGSLLVVEREGSVVGSVVAAWDGWRGNMYRLAVADEYRRRGLGLRLVRAAERSLRDRGARRVTALVPHDESAAVGLWEAAGYERDQIVDRFVRNL
jgi:ribosomal protein S18 acetylase RimI-like enzyme